VAGVFLLRPQPKLVHVTTNVADTQVVLKAASEDLKDFAERRGTASPGKDLDLDGLPRGKYVVEGSAGGYAADSREVDATKEGRTYEAPLHLRRPPAKSLKVKPPPYGDKGGTLDRVRVRLVHKETEDTSRELEVRPTPGPEADPVILAWGRWEMEVSRPGFRTRTEPVVSESGKDLVVSLEPLEEVRGTLTVKDAAEGSEVTAWDGEECVRGPDPAGPLGKIDLKVRACPLLVRVTKPDHDKFEKNVEVKEAGENVVSLAEHPARLVFVAPEGTSVDSLSAPGGATYSETVGPGKDRTREVRVRPGKWHFRATPTVGKAIEFDLELEPGQHVKHTVGP